MFSGDHFPEEKEGKIFLVKFCFRAKCNNSYPPLTRVNSLMFLPLMKCISTCSAHLKLKIRNSKFPQRGTFVYIASSLEEENQARLKHTSVSTVAAGENFF